MAIASRLSGLGHVEVVLNVVNLSLVGAAVAVTWWGLRTRLDRVWWWGSLCAIDVFAPAVSTIWWKQFNAMSLVLAAFGLWIVRRHRDERSGVVSGALAIALSISIKPVAVLVVPALLLKRDSRFAGIAAAAWTLVLNGMAQVFLAIRSSSWATLNPLPAYNNFSMKASPANRAFWFCLPENFSPQSILCRMGSEAPIGQVGDQYWTGQRVAVLLAVGFLAVLAVASVRGESGLSWRLFGFACALSPMISPIAWSHYQIMLAPLLVVLMYDFSRRRPRLLWSLSTVIGFVLCELVWRPYGTLPGEIVRLLTGRLETPASESTVFAYAAFAQFIIVVVALVYYSAVNNLIIRSSEAVHADAVSPDTMSTRDAERPVTSGRM